MFVVCVEQFTCLVMFVEVKKAMHFIVKAEASVSEGHVHTQILCFKIVETPESKANMPV